MDPNRSEADAASGSTRDAGGFQFSLLALLVLTTLVALACGLLFAAPGWVAALTMYAMLMALPAVWLTGVIYGRGYARTFCIAALVPAGAILLGFGLFAGYLLLATAAGETSWLDFSDAEAGSLWGVIVSAHAGLSVLAGTLAVLVRRTVEGPPRRRSRRALPPAAMPRLEQIDGQPEPGPGDQPGDGFT
jgi:hypothetical protein